MFCNLSHRLILQLYGYLHTHCCCLIHFNVRKVKQSMKRRKIYDKFCNFTTVPIVQFCIGTHFCQQLSKSTPKCNCNYKKEKQLKMFAFKIVFNLKLVKQKLLKHFLTVYFHLGTSSSPLCVFFTRPQPSAATRFNIVQLINILLSSVVYCHMFTGRLIVAILNQGSRKYLINWS